VGGDRLAALERSIGAHVDATVRNVTYAGTLGLYREFAVAVNRVASSDRRAIRAAAFSPVVC
jgi:hypothetical protein